MINLGSWMNKVLTGWGVDEKIANTFDEAIIAILLVAVAIGLDYLCQAIFVVLASAVQILISPSKLMELSLPR